MWLRLSLLVFMASYMATVRSTRAAFLTSLALASAASVRCSFRRCLMSFVFMLSLGEVGFFAAATQDRDVGWGAAEFFSVFVVTE